MLRRLDGVLAPTKEKVLQTVGKLEPPSDDKDKKVGKVGYGIFLTTQLLREKSWFLPFNQGRFGGTRGNPPVPPTQTG